MRVIKLLCCLFVLSLATMLCSITANAAAFQNWLVSASELGYAQAGSAANAYDANTAYYNPAGLIRLQNPELSASAIAVYYSHTFKGAVKVNNSTPPPLNTNVNANGKTFSVAPELMFTYPVNDRLALGFNITTPYAMHTDYERTTAIRYLSTDFSLYTIDLGPSLGIKITNKLSIGAGLDVQYLQLGLGQVLNVATFQPETDADSGIKLNDWGIGYNLGALYQFTPRTRVGISYRSKIDHHPKGTSFIAGDVSHHANAHITLPSSTMLSIYQKVNQSWELMATAIYTWWSDLHNFKIHNSVPHTAFDLKYHSMQEILNFHNTWYFSLGTAVTITKGLKLKMGLAYDETPMPSSTRNAALPDSDRYIITTGADYTFNKVFTVALTYAHYFFKKTTIDSSRTINKSIPYTVGATGKLYQDANIFGLQLTYKFNN